MVRRDVTRAELDAASGPRASWEQERESPPIHPATALQRAARAPGSLRSGDVLSLQRAVGNRAVAGLRAAPARPAASGKLTVGPAGDVHEQEADRIAQRVVARLHAPVTMGGARPAPSSAFVERGADQGSLQRKADLDGASGHAPADVEAAIAGARGAGQPIVEGVRRPMERAFGADFGGVRVHTDPRADQSSRAIGARAFTSGQDIFFRRGAYDPASRAGQELIAHELTHVVQQNGDRVQRATAEADDGAPAPEVSAGGDAGLGPVIQRKVGFEVELGLDLRKQQQPRAKGPRDPLLEREPVDPIQKGETIVAQDGWRMTPDGHPHDWYPELITAAFDETTNGRALVATMDSMSTYVRDTFGGLRKGQYAALPRDFEAGWPVYAGNTSLAGNIHITVGIRPDRITPLLEQIASWSGGGAPEPRADRDSDSDEDFIGLGSAPPRRGTHLLVDNDSDEDVGVGLGSGQRRHEPASLLIEPERPRSNLGVDPTTRALLGKATGVAKTRSRDPAYQGLVALLANYVAGQQRVVSPETARTIKDALHERNKRLDYCVDARDILEYMRTGQVTNEETLRYVDEKYDDRDAFLRDLDEAIGWVADGPKLRVPVLSRSSLGELRQKVHIDSFDTFVGDVLAAASLPGEAAGARLFPVGIEVSGRSSRTIERDPNITIGRWVRSVFDERNLTWSDQTYAFEDVGPATSKGGCWCLCCCFGWDKKREKGAVVEIRALDKKVPPDQWGALATEVIGILQQLNAADTD